MQADNKEIYRLTSERTKESEELYKEVGGFVFTALYKEIRKPNSLIINLKGVGRWHLRRKRIDYFVNNFIPEDPSTSFRLLNDENRAEICEIFKERSKDYERYVALRDEIRKIRHASQKLIETSQDNLGERKSSFQSEAEKDSRFFPGKPHL